MTVHIQYRADEGSPGVTPRGLSDESLVLRRQNQRAQIEQDNSPASRDAIDAVEDHKISQLKVTEGCLIAALKSYEAQLPGDTLEKITARLSLLMDPSEWDEANALPAIRSFILMTKFLTEHPEFRPPSIFLSPQGLFSASWRRARNMLATLEFCPSQMILWLVFSPKPDDPEESEEAAGRAGSPTVLHHLANCGALNWMRRDA